MSILDRVLGRNPHHVSHRLKGQKRLPNETQDEYKKRLRKEQRLVESYLEGDLVWCSKAYKSKQFGVNEAGDPIYLMVPDNQTSKGTYEYAKHGPVKSPRRA